MGRPPKIRTTSPPPGGATTLPAPPPSATASSLQADLDAAQREIERIHREEDVGLVATGLRLAGVQQRYWDLRGLLAVDVNEQLACARQSASWAEQQVRAAKALSVDLLRELFAKAEAMERHSSALKDLK